MTTAIKGLARKCKLCKTPFVFEDGNQRYCTPACQQKAEEQKQAALGTDRKAPGGNHQTNWLAAAAESGPGDLAEVLFQMLMANEAFALVWLKLQGKVEIEKRRRVFAVAVQPVATSEWLS